MKFFLITLMILVVGLQACSRQPGGSGTHVVTIKPQSFANTLYYSGTIQPIKTVVIPSPAEGVVVDMPFQYGERVKPGQLLFMLSSAKFLSDYKSALMQYIKTKNEFNNIQSQLSEAKFLHTNQLISDDEYKTKQSNFYAARLALLQAKDALENLLHQIDIKNIDLYGLSIADIDKITQAMHLQMSAEILRIMSPGGGVILSANKNEEENKKITKGDVIKQGDVLALIGDMSGISVHIKVNELVVNQLKVGQKVKITGIAFPEHILAGEIKRIDRQGETSNTGLPTFSVEIMVPELNAEQEKQIHVGMTAKVEIDIAEEPHIMVPIAAIHEQQGEAFVNVYNPKKRKSQLLAVKTGKTTPDAVIILAGLKSGDKIVIPD